MQTEFSVGTACRVGSVPGWGLESLSFIGAHEEIIVQSRFSIGLASVYLLWLCGSSVLAAEANLSQKEIGERSEVASTTTDGCRLEKVTLHSAAMGREIRVVVVLPPEYVARSRRRGTDAERSGTLVRASLAQSSEPLQKPGYSSSRQHAQLRPASGRSRSVHSSLASRVA